MGKDKTTLKKFYPIQYENLDKLKQYLEEMAEKGWMFKEVLGSRLLFEKCEPVKLNFAVEIFDKTSEYATYCNEENLEYIEYCETAGWNYISSFGYLQFFYSEDMELTPIETDDRMKVDSVWKAGKNIRICNLLVIIFSIFDLTLEYTFRRMDFLTSYMQFSCILIWLFVLIMSLVKLISVCWWKNRCMKAIKEEKAIPKNPLRISIISSVVLGILGAVWIGSGIANREQIGEFDTFFMITVASMMLSILISIYLVNWAARKWKPAPKTNFSLQVGVGILNGMIMIAFVLVGSLVYCEDSNLIYEQDGASDIYLDSIPYYFDENGNLVEQPKADIEERLKTGYDTYINDYGSFWIGYAMYHQRATEEVDAQTNAGDKVDIMIREYHSKYSGILKKAIKWAEQEKYFVMPTTETFKNAQLATDIKVPEGYQVYYVQDEDEYNYLLESSNRIVAIYSSVELNDATLAAICE